MSILFASDDIRTALGRAGLDTLERVLAAGTLLPRNADYRGGRHAGRDVATDDVELDGEKVCVYLKRQHRRERKFPRLVEIRTGMASLSHPEREWRGLGRVCALGINAAQPLALFTDDDKPGRAAIITRALPVELTLHDLLDSSGPPGEHDLCLLADAVVDIMRRIFSAGLAWRSMKAKHFYPRRGRGGWEMWLLDCEGVHGRALRRDMDRSIRVFMESLIPLHKGPQMAVLVEDILMSSRW